MQGDFDQVGKACCGLIDGIVDQLPHQMVKALGAGAADVHAWAFADSLKAFEQLNALCVVGGGGSIACGGWGGLCHLHLVNHG